ncbi:MAG TPA: hypothetical protein VE863_14865 [Pyrinomonadaceae bacterium]|jgi:hypothetical protein|nr:hypothetical protein [Pyrinomonadaceae bacterium]
MTEGARESIDELSSRPWRQPKRLWLIAVLVSIIVATSVVAPMCFLGCASGHDFQPHVSQWIEAAGQFKQGIFFPRWAGGANSGYGEPRFIFYPPGSWMLGGVLGLLLPWKMVPGAVAWIAFFIATLSSWIFARDWLSPKQALTAAILFAINPYNLTLVFYRSDFAELLAGAFLPFMLAGAFGILKYGWRRIPLLSIGFAAMWLANAPAGVIASYSLALLLVIAPVLARRVQPLIFGALGMLGGFGLAAFYLVPAAWEQKWVEIGQAVSPSYDPIHNFLFTRLNDPDFIEFNWKISMIAAGMILITLLGIVFTFRQRRKWSYSWWLVIALSVACVFLMLPPSSFLWTHLPRLRFMQFPWRWLLLLGFAFAILTAAVKGRKRYLWSLTVLLFIGVSAVAIAADADWSTDDLTDALNEISAGRGYDGIDGFQPRGAKTEDLDEESPLIGEVDEDGDIDTPDPENVKVDIVSWAPERRVFHASAQDEVTLAPKLLNYPAWQMRVNGAVVPTETSPETGQILIHLASGEYQVELQFQRTRDRLIGGIISLCFAVGVIVVSIVILIRRPRAIVRALLRPKRSRCCP